MKSNEVWDWIATDLEVLARLHALELDAATLEDLWRSDFPSSMILNLNDARPIAPVIRKAMEEVRLGLTTFDQLAADYAAIYLNGTLQASPNESPWIDEDHLERQEPMFEIRNWYHKYGLVTPDWRTRQDDNLALQLHFMAHLLRLNAVPLKDLGEFMDFHILRWVFSFAERVFQRADTSFYAGIAELTAQYVNGVRELVEAEEGRPRLTPELVEKLTKKEAAVEKFDAQFYTSADGGW